MLDVKINFITLETLNPNKKADQLREKYFKIYFINELGSHIIDLHFLFLFWSIQSDAQVQFSACYLKWVKSFQEESVEFKLWESICKGQISCTKFWTTLWLLHSFLSGESMLLEWCFKKENKRITNNKHCFLG